MSHTTGSAKKITCPNDGSTHVHWNIAKQKFHCVACRREFDRISAVAAQGETAFNGIAVDNKIAASLKIPENLAEYKCVGCGAMIILDKNTSMKSRCSWCRNELVPDKVISSEFTPNGIVPFSITKEKAIAAFRRFIRKHWFVRKDFAAKDVDIEVKAIYYPFYALDRKLKLAAKGTGSLKGSSRRSGDYVHTTYTDYAISASAEAVVDDFEKPALNEIKNQLIVNNIEPYDWTKVQIFDYAYLNAFAAEHRDIELSSALVQIDKEISNFIKTGLSNQIQVNLKLTEIKIADLGSDHVDEVAYCLAPVWLITYTDQKEKRVYFFALNGQTGKVSGILPISWQKLSIFLMIFTLAASVVAAILNIIYLLAASRGGT